MESEGPTSAWTDRLRRFSGPIVYGRVCGVRRRTARRWSRALPFPDDEVEEEEDEMAAAVAIAMEENMELGGG